MKEGLLQLLKLQEVDKKLFSLEEAKEKYPAEIDLRRSRIAKARSGLADLEAQSAEFAKQQRHCEREIESSKATLREREERFSVVTTNKDTILSNSRSRSAKRPLPSTRRSCSKPLRA